MYIPSIAQVPPMSHSSKNFSLLPRRVPIKKKLAEMEKWQILAKMAKRGKMSTCLCITFRVMVFISFTYMYMTSLEYYVYISMYVCMYMH